MIAGLQPYGEYKESGQDWLGKIPVHWEIRRTKYLLQEVDSRSMTGDEQLLRVSQYSGVTPRHSKNSLDAPDTRASSLVGYKMVGVNDLVINIMLAWNGSLGIARDPGIVSPAYCVYRFQMEMQPWYFHHLFRTPLYKGRIKAVSTGVVESRLRLYSDDLGRLEAILPPPDEQAAIVRFLDHANRKIDRFIRAKRKMIALLNEQKQAIIHRAVTRGLNPDVRLKPSGVPWLGDIPEHWEVIRCGCLFKEVIDVGHPNAQLLSIDRYKGIIPQSETGRRTRASRDRSSYKHVKKGQLAYNLMNAFMGAIGFSEFDGIVSPAYAVAQPVRQLETRYFHHLLRTSIYAGEYNRLSYGIMYERNRLYFERFKLVKAIVPPEEEQSTIANWIDANIVEQNAAITRTEREITLMQEFRTRLTADVVTGKLDVRDAAAKLPELEESGETETEGDKPDDELLAENDTEESDE